MGRARAAALAVGLGALALSARAGAQAAGPSSAAPVSEGRAERKLTRAPKLVTFVDAEFPPGEARSAEVVLALTIDASGRVTAADVMRSGGAAFDAAAARAATRFVFEPAEVDGHPAAIKIRYTYTFTYVPPAPAPPAPAPAPPPLAPPAPERDVLVRGGGRDHDVARVTIAAADARRVAGTQGDPIKVLEDLPGLARPAFGSGQIIVWGSAPGDTRTYVDGVEVPALFHGSGLRSTVNGDLVRDVSMSPGAYGPEYGRGLGGVVRVTTRELPARGVHGYLGADTLDGSGMITAAPSERVRFALAGRYGWLDRVLRAADAPDVGDYFAIPRYSDYQAKLEVSLRAREAISAVFLGSRDDLGRAIPDADPARVRRESTTSAFQRAYLHYTRDLDDGARVDVVPWVGHDVSRLAASFGGPPASLDESTLRWGLRATHRAPLVDRVALTVGLDLDGAHADVSRAGSSDIPPREGDITVFGQPPGQDVAADAWTASVVDVAPYAVMDLDLGPLALSPGLRVDGFFMESSRQTPRAGRTPSIGLSHLEGEVEPRVSARLKVTRALALLAAAGLYSQPPSPADLGAVFGTPTLGPSTGEHASVGESLAITRALRVESVVFYKWMSDLAARNPSPTPLLAQALVQNGVGRSYGWQLLARLERTHGLAGFVSYTISRSERRDAPDAAWRLFDQDEPHVLTAVLDEELGAWTVGVRVRFASGLPRTPVVGALFDAKDDAYQPIFGAQNTTRLPAFWQIDARVDRTFALGDDARLLVYLEGLNVANHANAEEYVYNVDYTRRGTVTGLPIVAVLGARLER